MADFERILIAVDFSEHSRKAIDTAMALAKKFGSKVVVVHGFQLPLPVLSPYEVALPDNFIGDARAAARRELDAVVVGLADSGVEVAAQLRDGPADAVITELASELNSDLIVMGTRGNTGLKHVLLGSVAERTLRHAACPVLTVK